MSLHPTLTLTVYILAATVFALVILYWVLYTRRLKVPRNMGTVQIRFQSERWGVLSVDLRSSGQQFDDSANQYRLAGYAQVDLFAQHVFKRQWQVYLGTQNLLNQPLQAGKTPILTLGAPVTVLGGVRFSR